MVVPFSYILIFSSIQLTGTTVWDSCRIQNIPSVVPCWHQHHRLKHRTEQSHRCVSCRGHFFNVIVEIKLLSPTAFLQHTLGTLETNNPGKAKDTVYVSVS